MFAEFISEYLYGDVSDSYAADMRRAFREEGVKASKPRNMQLFVNLMIDAEKYFLGDYGQKLSQIYRRVPLHEFSYKKTLRKDWYHIAGGIRELYEMDQSQYSEHIEKYRDHKNLYVRREVQIAMVVFHGWKSLQSFIHSEKRITLWEQIKIVEKLHDYYPEPDMEVLDALLGETEAPPSGKELLVRIIRKFKITERVDFVIAQLASDSFHLRETAIHCLHFFSLSVDDLEQVKAHFSAIPDHLQQKRLLRLFAHYPVEDHIDFLRDRLHGEDALHRMITANILWETPYQDEVAELYPTEDKIALDHQHIIS